MSSKDMKELKEKEMAKLDAYIEKYWNITVGGPGLTTKLPIGSIIRSGIVTMNTSIDMSSCPNRC
jgi:hypothetical protein